MSNTSHKEVQAHSSPIVLSWAILGSYNQQVPTLSHPLRVLLGHTRGWVLGHRMPEKGQACQCHHLRERQEALGKRGCEKPRLRMHAKAQRGWAGHKLECLQGGSGGWPKLHKICKRWPEMRPGLQVALGVSHTTEAPGGGDSQGRRPSGRHLPTRESWCVHSLTRRLWAHSLTPSRNVMFLLQNATDSIQPPG